MLSSSDDWERLQYSAANRSFARVEVVKVIRDNWLREGTKEDYASGRNDPNGRLFVLQQLIFA